MGRSYLQPYQQNETNKSPISDYHQRQRACLKKSYICAYLKRIFLLTVAHSYYVEKNHPILQNTVSCSPSQNVNKSTHHKSYHSTPSCSSHRVNSGEIDEASLAAHFHNTHIHVPETHKSMWAVNSKYDSLNDSNDAQSNYRTRSLPSWGKNSKQRPASTIDDFEELYAQVNFTKKRRNRMRNENAAVIARCLSKSQNLTGLPDMDFDLESDGVIVYDERTDL